MTSQKFIAIKYHTCYGLKRSPFANLISNFKYMNPNDENKVEGVEETPVVETPVEETGETPAEEEAAPESEVAA